MGRKQHTQADRVEQAASFHMGDERTQDLAEGTRPGRPRHDTTPHGQKGTMGRWGGWVRGTPGWGRSTIFLFCVVKLGWIPPARPPFTEPLEEILLLVPGVLRPHGAPLRQLHRTGELHLGAREHTVRAPLDNVRKNISQI